ncbi:MAG TPA: deoxyribose-phosphate aldolase [Burkholderiaceae bacterium]|nr:deoxyribose-phosphate aldolase [Burkholderiaceae bacterium]
MVEPTHDAARLVLACLDLTSLNADDDNRSTAALVARALDARARWGSAPAALCVWPRFVATVRAALPATIAVAAVANFPEGGLNVERAVHDTRTIVEAGGDEVDLVLPWRALLDGDEIGARRVVAAVRAACPGRRLKLIVESGALPDAATLRAACRIGLDEGADFLKTSTGKWAVGATLPAARTMLEQIATHPRAATVGFKAAGGIRRVEEALAYIGLVREILGASALAPARLRFGASGLLDDVERTLGGGAARPPAGGY